MKNRIFVAVQGGSISRAEKSGEQWRITGHLQGMQVNCLEVDPLHKQRLYAGTQKHGLQVSEDCGQSWRPAGLQGIPVKSLAISPHQAGTIFAGCKPVSLYRSQDGGQSWQELTEMRRAKRWWWFSPADPPGIEPYVQAITISPQSPNILLAGIELGGVLRSSDGGLSWSRHRRGAVLDCHSLKFHPSNGNWVYEGGGGGAAVSQDGGLTWRKPKTGLKKTYGWMVAADPVRPEVWYLSASSMPSLLRGEFIPPAHKDGQANASIFRSVGGAAWEQLSGGLPEPLDYMAYGLIADPAVPGHLYAGLSNGEIWNSTDYGDHWQRLPVNLGGIQRSLVMMV